MDRNVRDSQAYVDGDGYISIGRSEKKRVLVKTLFPVDTDDLHNHSRRDKKMRR